MFPICISDMMVSALTGKTTHSDIRNEDYAHYLLNAPATIREPLRWRLVPQPLRTHLKARIAARLQEKQYIALWDLSPHLLEDVGVILSTGSDLPEHLVNAPARVIEHVAAIDPAQILQAEQEFPPAVQVPARRVQPAPRKKQTIRLFPELAPVPSFS